MVTNEKPIGIIITWSLKMLTEGGNSMRGFMKAFEAMNDETTVWNQKCRNKPRHEVLYCYIIIGGRIMYRANVAGYETEPAEILKPNGITSVVTWPRLVLCAPVIKAPHKIPMRGFQGFRYTTDIIF